jgi:putative heme transporter
MRLLGRELPRRRHTIRVRRVVDVSVPAALAPRPGTHSRPTTKPRRVAGGPVRSAAPPPDNVPRWLQTAAGYSWRLIVLTIVVGLVVFATSKIQLVFVAVFIALVITAVLRPFVNRMSTAMPRGAATAIALLGAFTFFAGLVAYVVNSVASQWTNLAEQFGVGIQQIVDFVDQESRRLPFQITPEMVTQWIDNGRQWLLDHSGAVASGALASLGSVVEVFTAVALATFCSVFFLSRGAEMWTWFLNQLPAHRRDSWHGGAGAGWYTFSGYARGTVLIALTDGILAAILLMVLGVPLAAPLAVLVFIGAFIPLIGAPLAMVIAMIVALAANGLLNALFVGVGIALIGQFEGHVLQPLVMGRQVSLHPVAVALAVASGTLVAGILGAIIAVPIVAVVWAVYAKLRNVDPPLSAPPRSIKMIISERE